MNTYIAVHRFYYKNSHLVGIFPDEDSALAWLNDEYPDASDVHLSFEDAALGGGGRHGFFLEPIAFPEWGGNDD